MGLLQRQTDPRSAHQDRKLPSGRRLNVSRDKGVYLNLWTVNRLSATRFYYSTRLFYYPDSELDLLATYAACSECRAVLTMRLSGFVQA